MRNGKRVSLFFVWVLAAATVSGVVLATPDEDDVTVTGREDAPACTFTDASIWMSNSSSDYDYLVSVTARAENDLLGNAYCSGDCFQQKCECSLNGIYVASAEDSDEHKISCVLPNCRGSCTNHCDNTDCDPVGHCTCVSGTYTVTYYKPTGTQYWYAMSSPTAKQITTKSVNPDCPQTGSRCP
jgi:hypothetical protein